MLDVLQYSKPASDATLFAFANNTWNSPLRKQKWKKIRLFSWLKIDFTFLRTNNFQILFHEKSNKLEALLSLKSNPGYYRKIIKCRTEPILYVLFLLYGLPLEKNLPFVQYVNSRAKLGHVFCFTNALNQWLKKNPPFEMG